MHMMAAEILGRARRVAVLTGAGMSAESGVPTFRDAQTGLWAQFDPEELATESAFRRYPDRVFRWYAERLRTVRAAKPHPGYYALVELANRFADGFCIITQNVDGLHARAGSQAVIELHGSLEAFRCIACRLPFSADRVLEIAADADEPPPGCARCGNLIRPGVVWFGEMLSEDSVERARRSSEAADVALVVGTSSLVYPAAELPTVVQQNGGRVIEINPQTTPLSDRVDLSWRATAGEALPRLVGALRENHGNS